MYQRAAVGIECWADELALGPLAVHGVPICEASPPESQANDYLATIGLYALRRMDMVIDGSNGWAYLRPVNTPPRPYPHNRAGVVFVPADKDAVDLTAHVVEDGPAYRAGVRDGDVLLKVDNQDVTLWKVDSSIKPQARFRQEPAGTRLQLTMRRGHKEFRAAVTLEDILR